MVQAAFHSNELDNPSRWLANMDMYVDLRDDHIMFRFNVNELKNWNREVYLTYMLVTIKLHVVIKFPSPDAGN